ncbi:MAG: DUF2452 domain-containing protein [Desulfofustis sp.]|nr:DUF2452 domain-containing protein [Desulfofustis sp.]
MKYKGEKHEGPDYRSPYPVNRLSPTIDLVEMARVVAAADDILALQAAGKLRLLAEQMAELQEKARQILLTTQQNQELHRVSCAFRKVPGKIYHLYRRRDNTSFFSLIAPAEWSAMGNDPPARFVGSYRLEADQSWTVVVTPS